jgi:DNA gyrase subunit A
MIYAVCDLDEVIRIIRASATREEAINGLMARRFQIPAGHKFAPKLPKRLMDFVRSHDKAGGVALTRVQAETIGGMRLIQLVGLEIEKLTADYKALVEEIEGYELILAEHERVLDMIREDCEEMKQRYGAPRITEIQDAGGEINLEHLIQVQDMAVTISHQGYAKRLPAATYRAQGRGGKGIIASDTKDDDFIAHLFVASTHDDLLVFTDTGRVFKMKVYELPEMGRTAKGRSLVNLIDLKPGERPCAYLAVKDFESGSSYLTFASKGGIVKRTALKDYRNVHKAGIIAVGLKEGDELLTVVLTSGTDDVLLVTARGMAIRFNEQDVRLMGRGAAGVKGITLGDGAEELEAPTSPPTEAAEGGESEGGEVGGTKTDLSRNRVVGMIRIPMRPDADGDLMTADTSMSLLTICENGYGKRTAVDEYRVQPETGKMRSQSRGGKGRADIKTTARNGPSVAAIGVHDTDDVVVVSRGGQLVRIPTKTISQIGRGTQGVRVVSLHEGDAVVAAARVLAEPEGDASSAAEPESPAEPAAE